MKKLISTIMLTILMLTSISLPAKASESLYAQKYSEIPTTGVKSKDNNIGTGSISTSNQTNSLYSSMTVIQDTPLITYGECSITNGYDGTIRGYGRTITSNIVQQIGYTLYLQTWNGYTWTDIYSTTVSRYNTATASQINSISVQRGKYYRVKVDHYAVDYGTSDSRTSISDYIYVN
jgi:hypothetical protein